VLLSEVFASFPACARIESEVVLHQPIPALL
jgi:hypothetical protein